jgi:hypothetical protein
VKQGNNETIVVGITGIAVSSMLGTWTTTIITGRIVPGNIGTRIVGIGMQLVELAGLRM